MVCPPLSTSDHHLVTHSTLSKPTPILTVLATSASVTAGVSVAAAVSSLAASSVAAAGFSFFGEVFLAKIPVILFKKEARFSFFGVAVWIEARKGRGEDSDE